MKEIEEAMHIQTSPVSNLTKNVIKLAKCEPVMPIFFFNLPIIVF